MSLSFPVTSFSSHIEAAQIKVVRLLILLQYLNILYYKME